MKFLPTLLGLAGLARLGAATFQPSGVPFLSPVTVAAGFSASVAFSNLTAPRGIAFDAEENLLVVERGYGVTAFTRVTSPIPGFERTLVVKNPDLTHGIQVDGKILYVSTAKAVIAYEYDSSTKSVSAPPYIVVDGLPADGVLMTHTLLLEKDSSGVTTALLVGAGPLTNIDLTARDPASGRSQIRRMVFPPIAPPIFPPPALPWANGEVVAYGIRNPAGFADGVDLTVPPIATRVLYVVENGASINSVKGITPLFANDNPSDELEFVRYPTSSPSTIAPDSYGYPDCTSLWNGDADPAGVPQYVGFPRGSQISLNLDALHDASWCKDPANNQPPSLNFQAHSAPLDIKFYNPGNITVTSFPSTLSGDAFVSFHGSFDRTPPTGYGVVHVPFPLGASSGSQPYSFIVQATDLRSCPGKCIRPVGLAFGKDGRLYVSSDTSGELFVIENGHGID
ncbi:hypothetical protein D9615_006536 [Tricholomella constricta]|uniref:Pyrroloquinoline quinone-dependent pyranose dehydrogenase beta-propeller domain-containing protein n=1 Tax=Tricholomella constricta TaxID=117010 RepID=A0A8H5M3K3_9AGAR|nr:hypothetical protein D9615_006536 [Tricholomella constricta]